MSNVINLPTYEQVAEVLTEVLGIDTSGIGTPTTAASNALNGNAHAKLNWLLTNLNTVNTNTATANLGAPTSAASNATSAVAHAKLNWLLTNIAAVNTNTNRKPVLKRVGAAATTGANIPTNMAQLTHVSAASVPSTNYLNISGSGRVLGFVTQSTGTYSITIDGNIYISPGSGYLDIPFSTSLQCNYSNNPPSLLVYELNT